MKTLRVASILVLWINAPFFVLTSAFAQHPNKRVDSTASQIRIDRLSVDVAKIPEKQNQDLSVQIEMINAQIQLNSDDAQSVLLYAAITAGMITFLLPILLNPGARMSYWYWRSVVAGVMLLSIAACFFFWFSRRITMNNFEHSRILIDMATSPNFDSGTLRDRIHKIPLYKRAYIPLLINCIKVLWTFGAFFYVIVPLYSILKRKCTAKSNS